MDDDYDNNYENISGEVKIHDKITSIKNIAKSYEKRMEGCVWDSEKNAWKYKNHSLAGQDFITSTVGILTSFCESSNLITTKSSHDFKVQCFEILYKVNNMILNSDVVPAMHQRTIFMMFKDSMFNIGDIITGSRDLLKDVFKKELEEKMEDNF